MPKREHGWDARKGCQCQGLEIPLAIPPTFSTSVLTRPPLSAAPRLEDCGPLSPSTGVLGDGPMRNGWRTPRHLTKDSQARMSSQAPTDTCHSAAVPYLEPNIIILFQNWAIRRSHAFGESTGKESCEMGMNGASKCG